MDSLVWGLGRSSGPMSADPYGKTGSTDLRLETYLDRPDEPENVYHKTTSFIKDTPLFRRLVTRSRISLFA
jgi:hypothetical protein